MSIVDWAAEPAEGLAAVPDILPPSPRHQPAITIPADIAAEMQRLLGISEAADKMGWRMDGMLFGYVGLDPLLSFVPVVGDMASSGIKLYFVSKAHQAKAPASLIAKVAGLAAIDLAFAALPGVGDLLDIVFRSHSWSARMIVKHIDQRLLLVDEAKARIEAGALEALEWQRLRTVLL